MTATPRLSRQQTSVAPNSILPIGSQPKLGVIELFAGAGGLAQGFLQTDLYEVIALTDIDPTAKSTYQHNFAETPYIEADIKKLKPHQLLDAANGRLITGVLGGPPCQGFSLNGIKDPEDKRNKYIREYARMVEALDPDFLLMENVPQMLFHPIFVSLLRRLRKRYAVEYAVLNAAQYGVPQTRHRAFIIAFHRRLARTPSFPTPTHGFGARPYFDYNTKKEYQPALVPEVRASILGAGPVLDKCFLGSSSTEARREEAVAEIEVPEQSEGLNPLVTVWDALADLAPLESAARGTSYSLPTITKYQEYARANAPTPYNHVARSHSKICDLIALIPPGGDLADVPENLWPKSFYSQAYGRLHKNGLARTITTYCCNAGSGRFLHPTDVRTITIREAARLQGFQDTFEFLGTQADQMRLVGNAVPPPLARALGQHIYDLLKAI